MKEEGRPFNRKLFLNDGFNDETSTATRGNLAVRQRLRIYLFAVKGAVAQETVSHIGTSFTFGALSLSHALAWVKSLCPSSSALTHHASSYAPSAAIISAIALLD